MAIQKIRHKIKLSELDDDIVTFEIAIPMVNEQQAVTSATLTTLNGQAIWNYDAWTSNIIKAVYVEVEWESAGAGDLDLYDVGNATKLADLAAPTGATSKDIVRYDVTSEITGLTADTKVGIQAAGDGTNALTVYSAKLVVVIGIS